MVKQSSTVSKSRYPVRSEGFDYGCSAQTQGPTLGLGGSFLVSYPYMQYTNPNNSRFAPMDTLTYHDRSDVMEAMADYVLDTMAYESAVNRKLQQERANYYQDVAALVNESPNLQRLSSDFEKVNPVAESKHQDKVVYTEVSMPPKVVRKGSQDIVIPQTQQVVRDVENFEMDDKSSTAHSDFAVFGFAAAVCIVLGIIYYASKDSKTSTTGSFAYYY